MIHPIRLFRPCIVLLAAALAGGCTTEPEPLASGGCALGQQLCDGVCVQSSSHIAHCGACGNACSAGQSCEGGSCVCAAGLSACGTDCVDTTSDAANCGACGAVCTATQVCSLGSCSSECSLGLMACGQSCVDTQSNSLHCGGCDNACLAGLLCVAGACQCPVGRVECAGRCTDVTLDVQNCGACGVPCAAGQTCSGGACLGSQSTVDGVTSVGGATSTTQGSATTATTIGTTTATSTGDGTGGSGGATVTASTETSTSSTTGGGTGGAGGTTTDGGSTTGGGDGGHVEVPFILGADISYVQELEDQGVVFMDGGVQKDMLELLGDHGFNYIRLRLFHSPKNPGGYAADRAEAYCDTAHTIEMAQRVKAAGMGFLLDFHYSDTWADPGVQQKPAAWVGLSFSALVTAVYDYTRDTLLAFQSAGAIPDIVQVGNEISPGMLHPDGHTFDPNNWPQLAQLLTAGLSAVKEVDPEIQTMLHLDRGGDLDTNIWWLDEAVGRGVQFDVLGESNYTVWQGGPSDWTNTFAQLGSRYSGISFVIAEYNGEKRAANDVVRNIAGGRGMGTFFYEPTASGAWGNGMFTWSGSTATTIPSDFAIFDQIADDYGLR